MQTEVAIEQNQHQQDASFIEEPIKNLKKRQSYFSLPKLLSIEQLKWIMRLAVSEIYLLIAAIVCLLIVSVIHLAVPKFIGSLIDMVTNPQQYANVCTIFKIMHRMHFGNWWCYLPCA